MTSLLHRFARPALVALLLSATALQPVWSVESIQTAQSNPFAQFDLMPLFRSSISGSYLAGQQALQDLSTEEAARYFTLAAKQNWENPVIVERAFIALAADGQIGEAASTAKHLLDLDPTNELAELVVATQAVKELRYDAAGKMLGAIGQDSFTGITATIMQAWALVGDNRADDANALLDKLGETGLEDFLVFHRALMAEASGDTDAAIELAGRAFDAEPYVARIVEVYARVLANAGRFEEARDVIAQFEDQGLTHPIVTIVKEKVDAGQKPGIFASNVQIGAAEMYHGIGVALSRDGSLDLSLVFLRLGLYLDPSADVISLALGQLLDSASQHDVANQIYEGVPATSPMKPTAVVRVATNLDAQGDRPEALRRLNNIVLSSPEDLDAISVYGDLLRYDEQYAEAAEAYTKALDLTGGENQADWRFYYVRGIAYERAKEWPKAEADFLKALELNPDQPAVLNYLGYSWIDQGMNLEAALEMIEKAVAAQPQDGYIVDSLGWAFYKLGRMDEAVATLEKAVLLRPNDAELNDHLGDAYWNAGRKLEARFQWNVASSVDQEGAVTERVAGKLGVDDPLVAQTNMGNPTPTVAQADPIAEPVPAPEPSDPAVVEPVTAEPAPEVVDPVPAAEPEPDAVELTPAPVEPEPVAVEPTPAPVEPEPAAVEPTPAPVEPVPAVVETPPVETRTVERGDSLWRIARELYGSGAEFDRLLELNREMIEDPDLIYPGMVLVLPGSKN